MMLLDFLNIGLGEIILIIITLLFWAGLLIGLVLIVKLVIKKKENSGDNFLIHHYKVVGGKLNEFGTTQPVNSTLTLNTKEKESSKIALPQQSEIRYVEISQIIRCEADDNYTKFILHGENILISRSLKEYADLLKPHHFIRTHQSHLVNPSFVKSWLKEDGGTLLMENGDKIPVSKPNRESVKMMLSK